MTDWYGTWDGPARPLPEMAQFIVPGGNDAAPAKRLSREALVPVLPFAGNADSLAYTLQSALPHRTWDGFVLDLTSGSDPSGVASLAKMADTIPARVEAPAPR